MDRFEYNSDQYDAEYNGRELAVTEMVCDKCDNSNADAEYNGKAYCVDCLGEDVFFNALTTIETIEFGEEYAGSAHWEIITDKNNDLVGFEMQAQIPELGIRSMTKEFDLWRVEEIKKEAE